MLLNIEAVANNSADMMNKPEIKQDMPTIKTAPIKMSLCKSLINIAPKIA
jgi:hypothetical protein